MLESLFSLFQPNDTLRKGTSHHLITFKKKKIPLLCAGPEFSLLDPCTLELEPAFDLLPYCRYFLLIITITVTSYSVFRQD